MDKLLSELKMSEKGKIINLKSTGRIRRRLIDLGVVYGAEIYVKRYSPMRDPLCVEIKGCELYIRKEEAKKIIVKTLDNQKKFFDDNSAKTDT